MSNSGTIDFGNFKTIDNFIRHTIGIVALMIFGIFLINALVTMCKNIFPGNKKEKLVYFITIFTSCLILYYEIGNKIMIIWEIVQIMKVGQILLIAILLLDNSIPHIYSEKQVCIISTSFYIIFIAYTVSEIYFTFHYKIAYNSMECIGIKRFVPTFLTFGISNLFIIWALYLCNSGATKENHIRRSILQNSFLKSLKSLSDSGYKKHRSKIKNLAKICYFDLFVYIAIEILLGTLAHFRNNKCFVENHTSKRPLILCCIPIILWIVSYIIREGAIFYLFLMSSLIKSPIKPIITNVEDEQESRRGTMEIKINRIQSMESMSEYNKN